VNVRQLIQRAATVAAVLGTAALLPQATLADGLGALSAAGPSDAAQAAPAPPQAPQLPPMNITVQISDKGFDSQTYNASSIPWPSPNNGTVTFQNTGSQVHTATFLPGTQGYGVRVLSVKDGKGGISTCFSNPSLFAMFTDTCGRLGVLDTGGIEPGGSVTVAFPQGAGKFTFTSATDCLGGNRTPGFNCAPSTLNEVTNPGDMLSIFEPGSSIDAMGSKSCVIPEALSSGSFCFTAGPQWTTVGGSPDKPLNGATVTIDDIKGFQPTVLYVQAGTQITWVNKGTRVHSVSQYGPYQWQFGQNIDKGLGPGESYTANIGCNAGPGGSCAGVAMGIASKVSADLIPPSQNGASGLNAGVCFGSNDFGPGSAATPGCGVPAMTAEIFTVPAQ